jgi:RING finger/CCCH-type zinc finger protein
MPLSYLQVPKVQPVALITSPEDSQHYEEARQCVEELALYLKPLSNNRGNIHTTQK